ncbi:MAG: hypothetical protein E7357_08340, partial [Clostridiales bacterium]|nr:hypothetical protein [Clostridiales bacterium]
MKTMKKRLQKWILGGLSVSFVCSVALGVGLTFVGENAVANEEKEPILAPRYIYDTSLNDAIFGVGSKIALPKATIINTLREEPAVTAAVTVSWNENVVDGYDEAETYEDDFTFSKAGKYEIVYSYAQSEDTPKDTYTVIVNDDAPVITAVERTPYIVPTGTKLTKPQTTAVCGDETLDSEVNIYYPNESAYRFQETTLDESGLYEIEFKTVWNDTVYSYVKSVYAYGINATFTGTETPYYGAPSFEKTLQTMKSYTENQTDKLSWTDGLNVSFGKGDVFTYDKPIRLSELGSTDKLVQFYVEPTGAATVYVYVELVDVNDENNVLSVRFSSVPMYAGSKSYRTYVSTAATGIGQVYAGRKDDILYVDRLSAGTYTCIDVSGLQDTNFYHPLSFAYDEATKQVYTGLVNREPTLIVADLDDTTTYFEKAWSTKQIVGGQTGYFTTAWDGFSSDEVYVRMRVDGSFVGSVQTAITKIGNHDLQPRFASLLPAPNVRHQATWMPSFAEDADYSAYYGAPSFEEELFDMESCDKTGTDQFTWTDGINVSLDVGDTFHYPDLVDLSTLSETDKLFQMLVKPTGNTPTTLYVELIDENDPENILSVRFVSFNVDSADKNKYRVYVTAAALKIGQPYTGVQTGTINTLYYNRPTGGYYTSVDVSGLTSNIYYPLNFAYDETTKQVLFGFANRTTLGVVAD